MNDKIRQFEVPNSNIMYCVRVFDDDTWVAYKMIMNTVDYANEIKDLVQIPISIRECVKLYIDKCYSDYAASNVS